MSKWEIKTWEDATRPAQASDFDWSPGWNQPDPGRIRTLWAKFRVYMMNLHINYVMNEMFYWMVRKSHIKLELEKGDIVIAQANHAKFEGKFHQLLEARNAYAARHRVKAHPDQPDGKKEKAA